VDKLNQWLALVANVGVIAGLVFVAIEVRTNTDANRLAIYQNYSQNWFQAHAQIADSADLAQIVENAMNGEDLSPVEHRRFQGYVFMRVTNSNNMLRAYDRGLIDEAEMRDALRAIRASAQQSTAFAEFIDPISDERLRSLILDEDGLDLWL
jgi:hypothetical protein